MMVNLKNIQTEVDASYLYKILAEREKDPSVAKIFKEMGETENSHVLAFLEKNNLPASQLPLPSRRARILHFIGKVFGYSILLGVLLDTEKNISSSISASRKKFNSKSSISDTAHVSILENILNNSKNISGANLAKFEKRHRSMGGNALRAAVLGGNDGLVSNFSLVMGIAGASIGAIIPVIPFFFMGGSKAILICTGLSAAGLFMIGSAITLFTGNSIWFSGSRQVIFGLAAAAITFGIGKWIGVSIAG